MQLDLTTRKLQSVLTTAATTAAMNVTVGYVDITSSALPVAGLTPTNTNGTTPVDILAAPAASTVRKVNSITIYNADTAAKTVSVNLDDNGTDYLIVKSTLQIGETLGYTDTRGWYSLDANGNTKVSPLTAMTSAQLAALLSDETGTNAAVFQNNATLTGTTQVAALTASGLAALNGGVSTTAISASGTGTFGDVLLQQKVGTGAAVLESYNATNGVDGVFVANGSGGAVFGTPVNEIGIGGRSNAIVNLLWNSSVAAKISSAGIEGTGALSAATTTKTGGYTVATIPAGTAGMRAYVTDATAPTFLGALTGGGAVVSPVFYNGSAWVSA